MNFNPSEFMPSFSSSAMQLALRSRRRRRRLVALRLLFVTLAAVLGAVSIRRVVSGQHLDLAGIAAVLLFIAVLGVRVVVLSDRELDTAESRAQAVSEIVASHAWRYSVGARPYSLATAEGRDTSRMLLVSNLNRYQAILEKDDWSASAGAQITEPMSAARDLSLAERREFYVANRIQPALVKSGLHSRRLSSRDRLLFVLVLCVELVGIPAGAAKAFGLSTIDLLGVVAAAAASLALWAETLAYPARARLARSVRTTLTLTSDALKSAQTEHEWSVEVARIEDQLSLEYEAALGSDALAHSSTVKREDAHTMSPEAYFAAAEALKRQIWDQSDRLPKLEPDVIVALNPGGAILGGMLYFMTTRASDFLPLSFRGGLQDQDLERMVAAYSWSARKPGRLSILIVDASVKSGESLAKAVGLLRRVVEAKGWQRVEEAAGSDDSTKRTYLIRTAVIAKKPIPLDSDSRVSVDYFIDDHTERFPYGNI